MITFLIPTIPLSSSRGSLGGAGLLGPPCVSLGEKVSPSSSTRRADACMILRGCTSLQLGTKPATSTTSFHSPPPPVACPSFFCQPFVCPVDLLLSPLFDCPPFPPFTLLRHLPRYIYHIHLFFSPLPDSSCALPHRFHFSLPVTQLMRNAV
ncbi:hypothetical protein ASPTUDRAFT_231489 [Aspergillus tubingensis CBS 134.48]|uniref:Uncharacterized protein n=1 Tax=Aspergillus tubingensis (strain CBS 134.48) TaxID=767770 RepID=A0A1L9NM08_ASPTC|nr:hypothetical protein ASPTUDRAFT_231489 [Aspergillus tubingensis CBS 134.48]